MARIAKKPKSDNLYQALLLLKTEEEAYRFFQDLCTVTELRAMEQRFDVALLLKDGMIYTDILERTDRGRGLRPPGGLPREADAPQPHPRTYSAGSGLRHGEHDIPPRPAGL